MKPAIPSMIVLVAASATASAQTFPDDPAYIPLYCGGGPMSDLYADESGAIDERDIVGDDGAPAGLRASDADFFYLRLRLDEDPAAGGSLRPFAWGMEIDLDDVLSTYEVLMMVDGTGGGAGIVSLYRNTSTTLPNDPTDPANEPPIATYDFATHGRSVVARGSSYGGGDDFFLDFAIPWDDLAALDLAPDTPIFVWAASSSTAATLNGDFACHDGSTGEPTLDGIASDETVLDPVVDTDGDGFPDAEEIGDGTDPNDPNDYPASRLEGGGGCHAGGGNGAGAMLALLLGAVWGLTRSRARRSGNWWAPEQVCN